MDKPPDIPFYKPLFTERRDQGDPYILHLTEEADTPFRYYVFTSSMVPRKSSAFPCYASNDLREWTCLGNFAASERRQVCLGAMRHLPTAPRPPLRHALLQVDRAGQAGPRRAPHQARRRPEARGAVRFSGQVLTEEDWTSR